MSFYQWTWKPSWRRKSMDDPLFEDGNMLCNSDFKHMLEETDSEGEEEYLRSLEIPCQISTCMKIFPSNYEYEIHYNSVHKNQCNHCHRNFPTAHLLDIHILESHDSMFELLTHKQKMYQCLVEDCGDKFQSAKERKNHAIKKHHYPSNFRFDRPRKSAPVKKESTGTKVDVTQSDKMETAEINSSEDMRVGTLEGIAGENNHEAQQMESDCVQTPPTRTFVYKVPKNLCFGSGAQRGFLRPQGKGKKKGKKKHWHQSNEDSMETIVDIEQVKMSDLAEALDTS